jgi:general secretion pathway protein B
MSFILDALKKSENDRQRQSGPALFEVRVAAPKSKFPLLAVSIVSLLVVNLAVVGWLMLRKPAVAATPPAAAAAPLPQTIVIQQPAPVQPQPQQGYANNAPGQNYPQQQPYAQQGYNGPPPPNGSYQNNGQPNGQPNGQQNFQGGAGGYSAQGGREPVLADDTGANRGAGNPDDYAPASEPPQPGIGAGRVVQSTASGLPTYEEAATRQSIPPIHMDLHSYAPDPSKRFVLINMRRLYEGQSLPEGVKVESITNDGAIMSYQGSRFVLDSD